MEDFVRELMFSLAAYVKSERHRPMRQMLGLGGGFQLHGLLAFLRSRKVVSSPPNVAARGRQGP